MTRRLLPIALVPLLAACAVTGSHGTAEPPTVSHAPASTSGTPSTQPSPPAPYVPHTAHAVTARWHLPLAEGRQAFVAVSPTQLVVAGGLLAGDTSTDRAMRIDLTNGRVSPLPALAVPVHDSAAGLVGGAPTVVGGGNATEQSVVQSLTGGAWHVVSHLPTTRSDLSVVTGHEPYVIGGYDGTNVPAAILALGPGGRPRPVGSLVHGVRYAATALLHDRVYVFGGEVNGAELGDVQVVDTRTGRTRVAAHLPAPLGHAMAATVGERILLMGGRVTPDQQTGAMWWFDPATARFSPAGRLPHPLSDAAIGTHGHDVFLLGGESPSVTADVVQIQTH